MSDHSGLRYLFDQLNLIVKEAMWLAKINEFDFEIIYIKGKENKVPNSLSRWVQVNYVAFMSSSGRSNHTQTVTFHTANTSW